MGGKSGKKQRCSICESKKKLKKLYECDRCQAYICKNCIKENIDEIWDCHECGTLYDLKRLVDVVKPADFLKLWVYIEGYTLAVDHTLKKNRRKHCKHCGKIWNRMHSC